MSQAEIIEAFRDRVVDELFGSLVTDEAEVDNLVSAVKSIARDLAKECGVTIEE